MRIRNCVMAAALIAMATAAQSARADLYGYWAFEAGSGTTAFNTGSGGTGNATINGATWITTDPTRGTVLDFDGNANYVDAGFIPQATINGDFTQTIYTQLRSTGTGGNDVVLGNRGNGPGSRWSKLTPNNYEWQTSAGNGNVDIADITRNDSNTTWDQHTVVKSGTNFQYYLNGVAGASNTLTGTHSGNIPYYIGGDPSFNEDIAGRLDEVGFFNEALSSEKVAAMYNLGVEPDLTYNLSEIDSIFGVFDGEASSFEAGDDLVWEFASAADIVDAGLVGPSGQVVTDGEAFAVQLDAAGNGVIGAVAAVPEPASLVIWAMIGLGGFGLYRTRRKR